MRTGFSLVEVLVSLALLGILAVTSAVIFQGSLRSGELVASDREALTNRRNHIAEQFSGLAETPAIERLRDSAQ